MEQQTEGRWEQRWHPLRQEWVVYSAHRNTRPWSGAPASQSERIPEYDATCYLCPGNVRANGKKNPDYDGVFVFDNDYPVVGMNAPEIKKSASAIHPNFYTRSKASGIARVVCYDPRHNVTLADIPSSQVAKVFMAWREQMREFQHSNGINFVLIFENRGEMVGVSNPHPHCQIYAVTFPFSLVTQELLAANEYRNEHNKNIFETILECELDSGDRIIEENEHACAFVPFFARYAYEVMIFPKKRHATLITMSDEELFGLGQAFQNVIRRYDGLYNSPFPYVMSILQSPVDENRYPEYHLHLLLQPPLRSPGLQKYLAGPEIGGGNFMSDTIPEEKARELKSIDPESHAKTNT